MAKKAKTLKTDYTCWKCEKNVPPDKAKKDSSKTYVHCPYCGAAFIPGVGKWVRPYSTLTPEEKS